MRFVLAKFMSRLTTMAELLRLSAASKVLFVFSNLESVWKSLYLENFPSQIQYYRNWKSTYILASAGRLLQDDLHITVSGKLC